MFVVGVAVDVVWCFFVVCCLFFVVCCLWLVLSFAVGFGACGALFVVGW